MSVQAAADWRDRQVSAAEAVSVVRPGDRVFVGSACATPRTMVDALEETRQAGKEGLEEFLETKYIAVNM